MKYVPQITVVVSAYNEEKYLPKCITALKKQNYPRNKYSILVIDNNSDDNTAKIARSYGTSVIKEKKQGYVFSLNRGLKSAKGEIIAITDADSIPSADWLKQIAVYFEDPDIVGVSGSVQLDKISDEKNKFLLFFFNYFLRFNFACGKPHFLGPNMAIRKSAFMKIKNIDIRYKIGGDVVLGLQIKKYGKVRFMKDVSVVTSSRRFKNDFIDYSRDFFKYSFAYFCVVWLNRPSFGSLMPIR